MIEFGGGSQAEPATWTFPMWPGTPTVVVTRLGAETYVGAVAYGRDVLLTGPEEPSPEQARTAVRDMFVTRIAELLGNAPTEALAAAQPVDPQQQHGASVG